MLNVLEKIESELPKLLETREDWNSVFVDYETPYVERLWRQLGDNRIYLHKIHPCLTFEALFHPHPWPSAMKIVSGKYEMGVGYGKGMFKPEIAATIILSRGSYYEMTNPDGWHYVAPIDKPAYTLMVTGNPWNRWSPKPSNSVRLRNLTEKEKDSLFSIFKKSYSEN